MPTPSQACPPHTVKEVTSASTSRDGLASESEGSVEHDAAYSNRTKRTRHRGPAYNDGGRCILWRARLLDALVLKQGHCLLLPYANSVTILCSYSTDQQGCSGSWHNIRTHVPMPVPTKALRTGGTVAFVRRSVHSGGPNAQHLFAGVQHSLDAVKHERKLQLPHWGAEVRLLSLCPSMLLCVFRLSLFPFAHALFRVYLIVL